MEWSHLPVAGGLYDQHPQLLEEWWEIFAAQSKKQAEDERREKFERDQPKPSHGSRVAGRRGR